MRPWRIELLGEFRAIGPDRVVCRFRTRQTASLLAYLALFSDRSHSRDALTDRFWPDADPAAARHRLSVALSSLRVAFDLPSLPAADLLLATRQSVQLNPSYITTDVNDFHQALRAANRVSTAAERIAVLNRAGELYRGELQPGHDDPWVLEQRGWLGERFFQALRQLGELRAREGELGGAVEAARWAVALEPLREEAHEDLIRFLADTGQPAVALRQYRELERLLREELGTAPSAALRALAGEVERQSNEEGSFPISHLPQWGTFP